MVELNKIYNQDCLEGLKLLESIQYAFLYERKRIRKDMDIENLSYDEMVSLCERLRRKLKIMDDEDDDDS